MEWNGGMEYGMEYGINHCTKNTDFIIIVLYTALMLMIYCTA